MVKVVTHLEQLSHRVVRRWRSIVVAVVLTVPPLALAACGGTAASTSSIPIVYVKVNDGMSFMPDHLTIGVGTTDISIRNVGSIPHNLAIPALDVTSPTVNGGQTVMVTVHARRPGTYPFVCTFHVMNGMVGTLVVVPARRR